MECESEDDEESGIAENIEGYSNNDESSDEDDTTLQPESPNTVVNHQAVRRSR